VALDVSSIRAASAISPGFDVIISMRVSGRRRRGVIKEGTDILGVVLSYPLRI
jgi:hypothetical protein